MSDDRIIEEDGVVPPGRDQIRRYPDDKYGNSDQDAEQRFRRAATQRHHRNREDGDERYGESKPGWNWNQLLQGQECEEYDEGKNVRNCRMSAQRRQFPFSPRRLTS